MAVLRAVLDADEEFRSRVAEEADEAELGRASWLFVVRPEGWADELEGLLSAASTASAVVEEVADEQRLARRLAKAEERIARLEADVAAVREREARAVEELAAVRRARQASGRRVEQAEAERDEALAEAERLRAALAAAPAPAPKTVAPPPPPPPKPPPPPPPRPEVDVAGIRAALSAAADALDDAVGRLPDERPPPPPGPPPPASRPRRPKPARRRPVALPPAVLDDSPEAADFLVRVNGVVVLVDGYNATISSWPDLPLADQRDRLIDALAELVARTGADATVVFDGVDTDAQRARGRPVKVLFSPADTPADDVILDLVDAASLHRPVLVASDDRAVQEGAAERGANVLTRAQLLATLRRSARP